MINYCNGKNQKHTNLETSAFYSTLANLHFNSVDETKLSRYIPSTQNNGFFTNFPPLLTYLR